MTIKNAPWTQEEIDWLTEYQTGQYFHPYTCANRGDGNHPHEDGLLVPTTDGWVCASCDYTQDWCHDWFAWDLSLSKLGLLLVPKETTE